MLQKKHSVAPAVVKPINLSFTLPFGNLLKAQVLKGFLLDTKGVKQVSNLLYVGSMILAIVLVDVLFFRNHTLERLAANVGIVLLFGAFYWRFFKHI
jgi:hypothetical protein